MAEKLAHILSSINNTEHRMAIEKIVRLLVQSEGSAASGVSGDVDNFWTRLVDYMEANITEFTGPVDSIQFNLDPTIDTHQEGRMHWDADNNTISIGMIGGDVELQVGQEHIIRVFNHSGDDISNGSCVYISDAGDSKPRIELADADNTDPVPEGVVIGLTTELLTKNEQGFVTTQGLVRDVNTQGITEGVPLWLSTTPGAFTETRPTPPNVSVAIGYCIYAHVNNGIVLVDPVIVPRVVGLSDVFGTPSNGDTIRWNATTERFEFGA